MTTLNNVITALQREIDEALNVAADANLRTRLVAERVVLKLEVSIEEKMDAGGSSDLKFKVVNSTTEATRAHAHSLTIEFQPVVANSVQAAKVVVPTETCATVPKASVRLEPTDSEQVINALSSVFGAPGFDSSARATVFREVFSGLDPAQVSNLVASFSGNSSSEADAALRSAIQRVNGILRSGPQRSPEEGRKILARVFSRPSHLPVLKFIEETWKAQEDWLDTPMPETKSKQA